MSANKGHHRKHYNKNRNDKSKGLIEDKTEDALEHDDNNLVLKMFRQYAAELDDKHDRHERIVKLSRDVTIESKRIIFLLHNSLTDVNEEKREQIYNEADLRLNQLVVKNFKTITIELDGQDLYLYLRAYTAGLQEFIEALLYYQYLRFGLIEPIQNLNNKFKYNTSSSESDIKVDETELILPIPLPEVFLGLADFTGELMRRCINNLGTGNIEDCFRICNYVKDIYCGFLSVNTAGYKEIGRKMYVLKQSLMKMEYVCYTIRVRGSEIPRHILASVINSNTADINNEDDKMFNLF